MGKLEIQIGSKLVTVTDPEKLPFSVDYKLEDEVNFQVKKGSEATQITVPANLVNTIPANSYEQVGIEDASEEEVFKSFQPVVIKHDGQELLIGKAILSEATESHMPLEYTYDFYGDNNDWIITLKEITLFDLLKHIKFLFTKQAIIDSWQFDGTAEDAPFVFAPVRYGEAFAEGFSNLIQNPPVTVADYNMRPEYMKPSISKFWILYWGFKLAGYRIESEFLNTEFFRRQVMPWTWGNFLYSDGTRLSNLDFLAKSDKAVSFNGDYAGWVDVIAINDFQNGGFDNKGVYDYNIATKAMTWTYLNTLNYGLLQTKFAVNLFINGVVRNDSRIEVWVRWYKNNALLQDSKVYDLEVKLIDVGDKRDPQGQVFSFLDTTVMPGDKIDARIYLHSRQGAINAKAEVDIQVNEFTLEYIRATIGSTIDFENYTAFKKYKFLDFFRGIIDEYDLSIKTDSLNKTVLIEPTHEYQLPGEDFKRTGFFNGDHIDWHKKQDLAKVSKRQLYKDHEREFTLKYKDDTQDGLLKILNDRHAITMGASKYVFPERFKAGQKNMENRFFSPCVHFTAEQWKSITGTPATMIALIPENISNTSKNEAQNTFQPKSAYYKGVINGIGWNFDNVNQSSFPYMFAVNYLPGGESDPCLSYSDQRIGDEANNKIALGLLRRFFLPRLAIMRNGEWYNTWFMLKNVDVSNETHREYKVCRNQRWELIQINDFNPMTQESTNVLMRRWVPASPEDDASVFPSQDSVQGKPVVGNFDFKYAQLKALTSDIPK